MSSKIASHMTRIVIIGKLKSYEYKSEGFQIGKGILDVGKGQQARFTIFNNANGTNPHTKAADFKKEFKEGDLVFITGTDNRSYSEEKDQYYEDVQVWDYREAEEDEKSRWVFVYTGDIKNLNKEEKTADLSFINYKDEEMLFQLNLSKAALKGDLQLEEGCRVKVKGEVFNGLKMDYFGDADGYVTERNVVEVQVLNTAEQIKADSEGTEEEESSEGGLWG